jgi:hypothetical protein
MIHASLVQPATDSQLSMEDIMKHLRQLCIGLFLVLALSIPAFAGDMPNGITGEMGAGVTGEMSTGITGQIPTGITGEIGTGITGDIHGGFTGEMPGGISLLLALLF